MTVYELRQRLDAGEPLTLLDVRESDEVAVAALSPSVWIPMRQIPERHEELDGDRPIVVMCHAGVRSAQVARFLVDRCGFSDVFNLDGGIDAWSVYVDPSVPRY
jgi:rhodanese-related sulfurtransferase